MTDDRVTYDELAAADRDVIRLVARARKARDALVKVRDELVAAERHRRDLYERERKS